MALIEGGLSNQIQEVDAVSLASRNTLYDKNGNEIGKKHREALPTNQKALLIAGKNDEIATFIRTDRKGNIISGNYIPELQENFEGGIVHVQKWTQTSTTFVPVQSTAGGYVMNSTSLTTASAVHILQSQRLVYKMPRIPLQLKSRVRLNIPTNTTADFGFGFPSTTTLIVPNGVAIRVVNGLWSAVITSNNTEIATANITDYATGLTQLNTANLNAEYYVCDIVMDDDNVIFTVQNTQTGLLVGYANLPVPFSALKMFAATALPVYYRMYNSATPPATAPNFTITELQCLSTDWGIQVDAAQLAGNLGMSAGRNPFTGAQLGQHSNSVAPTSATLSNTAAGIAFLDGKFQFAAVAGSATDYALFAVAIPTGSKFLCEGIIIDTYVQGAATATTNTVLEWSMGFNSSGVSLATANIIRRQIGIQSSIIGDGIGKSLQRLDVTFGTPEVVESGRFIHTILNIPIGTATASQIFRGVTTVKGRFI